MNVEFIEWLERWAAIYKEGCNDCCGQDFYYQGLADAYEWALEKYKEICNDA